jgi:hypothetical protein
MADKLKALRNQIANDFEKAGLDGNGRFEKPVHGYMKAVEILQSYGIELNDLADSHSFTYPDRQITLDLAFTNQDDPFSPIAIPHMLVVAWHKFEQTGAYEVLAYVS